MSTRTERRRVVGDVRRYRLLRVELTELRDQLRARAEQPSGWLMMPGPIADRIQRMLDRGAMAELDEA